MNYVIHDILDDAKEVLKKHCFESDWAGESDIENISEFDATEFFKEYLDAYFSQGEDHKNYDGSFVVEGKFSDDVLATIVYILFLPEDDVFHVMAFTKKDAHNAMKTGFHGFMDIIENFPKPCN